MRKSKISINWKVIRNIFLYGTLTLVALINLFPFYWAFLSAFKAPQDILSLPPTLFPTDLTTENFKVIFQDRFDLYYLNSIAQAALSVVGSLFLCSIGGFIFAKFEFRGKELIFKLILATMMVPFAVLMIPMVVIAGQLKLINNIAGLVVPFLVPPFGIYLMRQFMEGIPNDLLDAARIDGASNWKIYHMIMIPLSKAALSTLGIFFFLSNWNRYLWPLITMYQPEKYTLPIGAAQYGTAQFIRYGPSMAAATFMMAPLIVVFFIFQRGIVKGIALTGLKG